MVSVFLKAEVTDFFEFFNSKVCLKCVYINHAYLAALGLFVVKRGGLGLSSQILFVFRNLDAIRHRDALKSCGWHLILNDQVLGVISKTPFPFPPLILLVNWDDLSVVLPAKGLRV